ncbi:cell division protein ZapA [Sandaracinobacteroides hominis]|uniref:cell division protein ZapA n=1 Tax=Sandaracinobacteroides hominis TaxID=2780086 RepID=UPI0018F3AE1F|nr:cell division protein ZapA [Sandaracinobacteroides hominis]
MAEISLSIGGRAYKLACRDGEEEDLRAAAGLLDSRVSSLMQAHGAVAEPRLLLMAALLVSGELLERKSSEARITPISAGAAPGPGSEILEALAIRAEALARKLEEAADAA